MGYVGKYSSFWVYWIHSSRWVETPGLCGIVLRVCRCRMSHGFLSEFSTLSGILWCEVFALGTVRRIWCLWLTIPNVTVLVAPHFWIFIGDDVSSRWIPMLTLSRYLDKTDRTGSLPQIINGIMLLATFFLARLCYGGWMVINIILTWRPPSDSLINDHACTFIRSLSGSYTP